MLEVLRMRPAICSRLTQGPHGAALAVSRRAVVMADVYDRLVEMRLETILRRFDQTVAQRPDQGCGLRQVQSGLRKRRRVHGLLGNRIFTMIANAEPYEKTQNCDRGHRKA